MRKREIRRVSERDEEGERERREDEKVCACVSDCVSMCRFV